MGPEDLQALLASARGTGKADPRLLVGPETLDDAGVFLFSGDTALVQTVDVITPIVDDPSDFGEIAAVNALSDVYAMGGTPLTALAILAFDPCKLDGAAAAAIMAGSSRALAEAGCTLVGGHTLQDPELKFGLAVTGTVDKRSVVTNAGASPGHLLYLTKPLGTGIISTALKADMAPPRLLEEAVRWMKIPNRAAAASMARAGASAATDVTGFGLLGHLWEMCVGAGVGASLAVDAIPLLAGIAELVDRGMVPAGAYRNRKAVEKGIVFPPLSDRRFLPLCDPQTSGGMLIAVPPERSEALERALSREGVFFARIGGFTPPPVRIFLL